MAVCVEFPRFRGEERIASSERVEVSFGSFTFTARLSDISVTGAQVRAPSPAEPGEFVSLKLQDVGEVEARITRPTAVGFAVEFIETDALRDALIRKIYCSPEARSSVNVSGRRLLNALVVLHSGKRGSASAGAYGRRSPH